MRALTTPMRARRACAPDGPRVVDLTRVAPAWRRYSFPDSTGSVKNWMGASTISDPDDVLEIEEVLDTTLKFDDKDDVVIPGGKPVSMRARRDAPPRCATTAY